MYTKTTIGGILGLVAYGFGLLFGVLSFLTGILLFFFLPMFWLLSILCFLAFVPAFTWAILITVKGRLSPQKFKRRVPGTIAYIIISTLMSVVLLSFIIYTFFVINQNNAYLSPSVYILYFTPALFVFVSNILLALDISKNKSDLAK